MSRILQPRSLPADWLEQVLKFDLKDLSANEKIIADKLISYIKEHKAKSLHDQLVRKFIWRVIKGSEFLPYYDSIPTE